MQKHLSLSRSFAILTFTFLASCEDGESTKLTASEAEFGRLLAEEILAFELLPPSCSNATYSTVESNDNYTTLEIDYDGEKCPKIDGKFHWEFGVNDTYKKSIFLNVTSTMIEGFEINLNGFVKETRVDPAFPSKIIDSDITIITNGATRTHKIFEMFRVEEDSYLTFNGIHTVEFYSDNGSTDIYQFEYIDVRHHSECRYADSGQVIVTSGSLKSEVKIDLGDRACNNKVEVTIGGHRGEVFLVQ